MNDGEVTELLLAWGEGDGGAQGALLAAVYDELRALASRRIARERDGHTLSATALVHEAYLRLIDQSRVRWQNRAHFFAIAAETMRRILVDHARARAAQKRGGPDLVLTVRPDVEAPAEDTVDLRRLDDALHALAALDPRAARVIELRYFGGLTIEETAEVVRASPATCKRDFATARAYLRRALAAE